MECFQHLVKARGCISSPFNSYEVQKILGSGSFGTVALCRKNGSDQKVALKMVNHAPGVAEAQCMDFLAMCGSASHHIVESFGSFNFNGKVCIEFEALDISLGDFVKKSSSLPLHRIRPIIKQMAEALMFLKSINVIHGDLKPDNVMMVDHVGKPLQVKIIDLGLACPVQLAKPGIFFGTLCYRAPEMAIGAPMHHSLDMWSLGCIAAEMYLGRLLFSAANNSALIELIVRMLGLPPRHVLDSGIKTLQYFCKPDGEKWIHKAQNGCVTEEMERPEGIIKILGTMYTMNPHDSAVDMDLFIDLVEQLLDLDPDSRIDPLEVLEHSFTNRIHVYQPCPHLESQSSSSHALSETPPVGQTGGLKRKREEEEECPEKRRFKGEIIVISSSESSSGPECFSPIVITSGPGCFSPSVLSGVPGSFSLPDSLSTKHNLLPGSLPTQAPKVVACSSVPDPKPHWPKECIPSPPSLPETPTVARTCFKKRKREEGDEIPKKRFKVVSVISSTDCHSAALSSGRGGHQEQMAPWAGVKRSPLSGTLLGRICSVLQPSPQVVSASRKRGQEMDLVDSSDPVPKLRPQAVTSVKKDSKKVHTED